MDKTIYGVIRTMLEEAQKTAKDVAQEIGKPYSTLMRELNEQDPSAKLGVEFLLPLMQACQSILPLRFLAARMGCRVATLPGPDLDHHSLSEELLATYPALAAYHQAIMEEQPLEQVAELRERVIEQAQADFVAYARKKRTPDMP